MEIKRSLIPPTVTSIAVIFLGISQIIDIGDKSGAWVLGGGGGDFIIFLPIVLPLLTVFVFFCYSFSFPVFRYFDRFGRLGIFYGSICGALIGAAIVLASCQLDKQDGFRIPSLSSFYLGCLPGSLCGFLSMIFKGSKK